MKTNNNVGLILAGLIAIVAVGAGCNTTCPNSNKLPSVRPPIDTFGHKPRGEVPAHVKWASEADKANFPNLAGIAPTNTPPAATTNVVAVAAPAPQSGMMVQTIKKPASTTAAVTNGMPGGMPCLFINRSSSDIALSAISTNQSTFTLELPKKTSLIFKVVPEEYSYGWTVDEDPTPYPTNGPAILIVGKKAIHYYEGKEGKGNFHAKPVIFMMGR